MLCAGMKSLWEHFDLSVLGLLDLRSHFFMISTWFLRFFKISAWLVIST